MNMATKLQGKAHECKHCGLLFDQLSAYKEHERTHTGVKLYTGKQCTKCFSRSSNILSNLNELTQERSRIHASIVKSALAGHQIASDMNELTQVRSRIHASIVKSASLSH